VQSVIRVAWRVPNTPDWVGGLHYFRNLLEAILVLPDRQIEPVILGQGGSLPALLGGLESLADPTAGHRYSVKRLVHRLEAELLRNGGLMARYLRKCGIQLLSHALSHAEILGSRSPTPALGWVPDFQHRHLPTFFTSKELRIRNSIHARMAREMQGMVFSSDNAREDFKRFYPHHRCRTYVLKFVASPITSDVPLPDGVLEKYEISEPYFHVPNQLWAHKNHEVVFDALRILDRRGACPLVISTGQTRDYRNPSYFDNFVGRVRDAGLSDRFRFLGLIEYSHVAALMKQAVCMINPSLFEGWSTTVEEAKTLGKRLLLSDIPVHREQAPARAVYFPPVASDVLADEMENVLNNFNRQEEVRSAECAAQSLLHRQVEFGRNYQNIVLSLTSS
jgi:glycosyltransferase involved in cell wall biosynthesis